MAARKLESGIEPAAAVLPLRVYRAIADGIPHMLWTANPDGELQFLNLRALQYTGLSAGQLQGWGWEQVLHPEDRAACVARWKRALASGRGYEAEYRLRRADGAYRWHHHAVIAMPENDRVMLWYGTCTDIEDRKNAVRLLEQARRTLESLVATQVRAYNDEARAVDRLSERELQVLQLVVNGLTSADIGEQLGLSPKSVDTYRSRAMAKLNLGDLPALVKFALRHGLTTAD